MAGDVAAPPCMSSLCKLADESHIASGWVK